MAFSSQLRRLWSAGLNRLAGQPRPRTKLPRTLFLERLEERTVLSPYCVTTTADSGPGSLRDAINQINADTNGTYANANGVDEIDFHITSGAGYNSSTGLATITPSSLLPTITRTVIIDGYTQVNSVANTHAMTDSDPSYNGVLMVTLDGSLAGSSADGLVIAGGNSTVSGLTIQNWSGKGIHLTTNGDDVIAGNYFTDTGSDDILVDDVSNNTIGGITAAARNVFTAGSGSSIDVQGNAATGNSVEGNYIGTDGIMTEGNQLLSPDGSPYAGILIQDASDNTIGGMDPEARNVVSLGSHSFNGIAILGDNPDTPARNNVVEGNYIGLNDTGTAAITTGQDEGVWLWGVETNNTIGGTSVEARNVISGWDTDVFQDYNGFTSSPVQNYIEGNYIGTNAAGNQAAVSQVQGGEQVGVLANYGDDIISGNLISGIDAGFGIGVGGSAIIQGNLIGTDSSGQSAIPNNGAGIAVGTDTLIGGTEPGEGNIIAYNTGPGVALEGGTGNHIEGNSIYGNGQLGIGYSYVGRLFIFDTNADNNQANHEGPNNLMNFPVLTSVQTSTEGTTVNGTLDTGTAKGMPYLPDATITLDFTPTRLSSSIRQATGKVRPGSVPIA
jgi:parallel beta-helix repeat protein